jgi:antitoxin VapB
LIAAHTRLLLDSLKPRAGDLPKTVKKSVGKKTADNRRLMARKRTLTLPYANSMKRARIGKRKLETSKEAARSMSRAVAKQASIFRNGANQAVRLPQELRFPADVKEVRIRKQGDGLFISPVKPNWSSFFAMRGSTRRLSGWPQRFTSAVTRPAMTGFMLDTDISSYIIKRRPATLVEKF